MLWWNFPNRKCDAISKNPGYLKLRKIRAAQNIARTIANAQNRVYVNSSSLMLNIADKDFDLVALGSYNKPK
ncbi:Prohibitin-2, partial [Stegodyphus mimosarum]